MGAGGLSGEESAIMDGYRRLDGRGRRLVARTIAGELEDMGGGSEAKEVVA